MRSLPALVLLLPALAYGAPPPGARLRDGGLSIVVVTDRFRSAALQLGMELGHTVRWGGFIELGALWPRHAPEVFASGGGLFGIGGSLAVQSDGAAAFLLTSELAASSLGCHGDRSTCAGIAGGKPSDQSLDLAFGEWLTRAGLRLTLLPDRTGTGIDLFLGPHWRQGIGASPVDLPDGLGVSVALGIGFHNK